MRARSLAPIMDSWTRRSRRSDGIEIEKIENEGFVFFVWLYGAGVPETTVTRGYVDGSPRGNVLDRAGALPGSGANHTAREGARVPGSGPGV